MKHILATLLLTTACFAQQIQISGGVSVSGSVTTTTAPQVITPQPLSVTPAQLPSGTTGAAYGLNGQGVTVSAANGTGPYTCAITGTLPTGLSMAACVISGTPTVAGTFNFSVIVTDSLSVSSPSTSLSIVINSSLVINQTTVPLGTVSSAYSLTFTATGGSGGGYVFTRSAGTIPPGLTLVTPTLSGTPTQAGSFPLTITVTDSGANTASWSFAVTVNPAPIAGSADNRYANSSNQCVSLGADGPVATPLTTCFFTLLSATPSPGATFTTTAANFQTTYNSAPCGSTIIVTAGTSTNTQPTLSKVCDSAHWMTIEGSGVSSINFPAEGTRFSPCWSNVASLPNRPAYPCATPAQLTAQFVALSSQGAMLIKGATYHRFIGLEFTRVTTPGANISSLIDLSAPAAQTNNIIFDRVWIHGVNADGTFPQTKAADTSTTRGIYLGQSNHIAVLDSYLSDFYDNGGGTIGGTAYGSSNGNTDAQCIAGGFGGIANSGWGVYKFVNNHCEASGEGILFGGGGGPALTPAGCTITVNCNLDTPTDLEVRRNLFFKPLSWNGNTTTVNTVGWPVVKNGFEMKTGAHALFEANVIQNCWFSAQGCGSFNVAPVNQQSGGTTPLPTCPTCVVQDFVYRYNYSYNVAYGIAVYSFTPTTCSTCQSQGMNRVNIHDNVIGDNMNMGGLTGLNSGDAIEILADNDPSNRGLNKTQNLTISHNTFVKDIRSMILFGGPTSNTQIVNLTMQNNAWPYGNFGFVSAGSSGSCDVLASGSFYAALNNCVSGYTVDHDGEFNWNGGTLGRNWPTNGSGLGNFFTTLLGSPAWFTSYGTGDSSMTPSNYIVNPAGPLHNAASDGSDVGANIPQLQSEISGVASY